MVLAVLQQPHKLRPLPPVNVGPSRPATRLPRRSVSHAAAYWPPAPSSEVNSAGAACGWAATAAATAAARVANLEQEVMRFRSKASFKGADVKRIRGALLRALDDAEEQCELVKQRDETIAELAANVASLTQQLDAATRQVSELQTENERLRAFEPWPHTTPDPENEREWSNRLEGPLSIVASGRTTPVNGTSQRRQDAPGVYRTGAFFAEPKGAAIMAAPASRLSLLNSLPLPDREATKGYAPPPTPDRAKNGTAVTVPSPKAQPTPPIEPASAAKANGLAVTKRNLPPF